MYKKALTDIVDPGDLDTQISILYDTVPAGATGNVWGEDTLTTNTIATRAKVDYRRGTEAVETGRITTDSIIQFTVRYRQEVTHKARVLYDGRTYDIEHIHNVGRKRYMVLHTQLTDR